ncbi:hypothetical protein [Marinobacter daqiaonensis]|uniref:hypothetical protein n=1 Tax=Marinobacter daqiaonensis TaxID=650891 RepID=UPI000B8458E4|nr:hypothetical protein [Marinobacter daqiaonensis]
MRFIKVALGFSVFWSCIASAEPYAEWGVIGKDMPLQEIDPEMKMPDASEVPFPPPPGGKFMGVSGNKFCTLGLRTELSVAEVCSYYHSELTPRGYSQIDADGLDPEGCQLFKDGDTDTDLGVMVSTSEDPMFIENGSTLVMMTYPLKEWEDC